ncbi:carboxypeptidase M-like, partial [Gigantopelta aegis]|uniref:carboxypeptidase M-like n=1 Tax=Gigantopelta aegis TaxID=1735272 RepID=UPI001B88A595
MIILLGCLVLLKLSRMVAPLDFNYHNHTELEQFLKDISQQYPDITRMHSIGKSVKDADLWVIVIGEGANKHVTLTPNVKYVANMHGNGAVGREMLLHLIDNLVKSYGGNMTLTHFLKTTTVHIMPTMNPDGFAIASYGNCSSLTGRKNGGSYDLNRNFPDYWVENKVPIQLETRAIMNWMKEEQFVLSINFHGGALVANYPFDNYPNASDVSVYASCPDDDVFRHLSLTYSKNHPTMRLGNHCNDTGPFKDGITNGALWYPVAGGMQDYNYIYAGCMETTLEISCCFYPTSDELPGYWERNKNSLISYLMQVHMGVKGLVFDENRNTLVGATVAVKGREQFPLKTTEYGEYWKLLLPGKYVLQ